MTVHEQMGAIEEAPAEMLLSAAAQPVTGRRQRLVGARQRKTRGPVSC
jgi:hypothetical protein